MDGELQEIERMLRQITNSTGTTEHVIQHIQGLYPAEKQTLPSENIKNTQQKKKSLFSCLLICLITIILYLCFTDSIDDFTKKSKKIIEEIIRYENTILSHESTIQ